MVKAYSKRGGPFLSIVKRRLLTVVMDGVGETDSDFGNAVKLAWTPVLDRLKKYALYTKVKAHGSHVGLPSDADMGNSEVGHNALGAGRVFDQGAKLVRNAMTSGEIFNASGWKSLLSNLSGAGTLHFIGLLSDGNVHSHQDHLHQLIEQAKKDGVKCVRLHLLLDGRDVGEKSAEIYIHRLEKVMNHLRSISFDVKVASGGGRMTTTMDRYDADWSMVERGWKAHVLGKAENRFLSIGQAMSVFREDPELGDQYLPAFVITDKDSKPVGTINDGDGVVFFNFRGDRSIEISKAFTEKDFSVFDRERFPDVHYVGMMEYDGDEHIPGNFLVPPPAIANTLGEQFAYSGIKQFACSETQKYGHVTFFWNGNRSGFFDPKIEEYVEIPSDNISFDKRPAMKAWEITEATIDRLKRGTFDFGRINFANGDMVGHTGNLGASVAAVSVVDLMLGKLVSACEATDTILVVTSDHGNCDEMYEGKPILGWRDLLPDQLPPPKTSHTLSDVPFIVYDPRGNDQYQLADGQFSIAHFAATAQALMGLSVNNDFLPPIIEVK